MQSNQTNTLNHDHQNSDDVELKNQTDQSNSTIWKFKNCVALCFVVVFCLAAVSQHNPPGFNNAKHQLHKEKNYVKRSIRHLQSKTLNETNSTVDEKEPQKQQIHNKTAKENHPEESVVKKKHVKNAKAKLKKEDKKHNNTEGKNEGENMIDMRVMNQKLKFDNPYGGVWTQGWNVKPVSLDPLDPLVVFVVPHSHCDPGWLKTFEEYYLSETSHILTTIHASLMKDHKRKFIWAEVSYFERWWRDQNQTTRSDMHQLILDKQFEFVTGGWVMPDEANSNKYAIEMQLQEGHDWLRSTFGNMSIPQYGWSIDPFGLSPTMAYVLKTHGFKGMLIQRVHYAIKKELAKRKHLEFNWRQTWDDDGEYDIFTHIMPFLSYDPPRSCGPDPKVCCQFDFGRLNNKYGGCWWGAQPVPITEENVEERAHLLLDQYQKKANLYRSRVVLAPLGDDFRYPTITEAEDQYNNYQRLFDYMNKNISGVKIQFGTLSEYFEAVKDKFEPPYLKGSFFTYADTDYNYWSGYYTSRVFDKSLDRALEQTLYAAESMGATKEELQHARRSLSLFQHHDAITGTSKPHVVRDFAARLQSGIDFTQKWMAKKISTSMGQNKTLVACLKSDKIRGLRYNHCRQNTSTYLYNPLPYDRKCGDIVIPSLGLTKASLPCEHIDQSRRLDHNKIEEQRVRFDSNGMMIHPFKEMWKVWRVSKGGAYLFFPGPEALEKYQSKDVKIKNDGYIVETPDWRRTVIERINLPDGKSNETNRDDDTDRVIVIDLIYETNLTRDDEEWVVRFSSDVKNDCVFYTDLNGFNFDTHVFREDLPTQSQVFPMPTMASIEDSRHRFTILSEHSQGVTSSKEGSIDVWLDRRLSQDDWRGLGEGVQDNVPTLSHFRVMLELKNNEQRRLDSDDSNDSDDSDDSDDDDDHHHHHHRRRHHHHHHIKKKNLDFKLTPYCKEMWEDLNHPFEIFGSLGKVVSDQ